MRGIAIIAALGSSLLGYLLGSSLATVRYESELGAIRQAQLRALVEAEAQGLASGQITISAGEAFTQLKEKIITRYVDRVKEVQIYVPVKAVSACVVPVGFVRLHNQAARDFGRSSDQVPSPASSPHDPPLRNWN